MKKTRNLHRKKREKNKCFLYGMLQVRRLGYNSPKKILEFFLFVKIAKQKIIVQGEKDDQIAGYIESNYEIMLWYIYI